MSLSKLKVIGIISFCLFLFNSFKSESEKQCELKPNVGVNSIVAGKSTLEDVIKEFSSVKIQKKWHKSVETEIFGHYEYFIIYKELGLTFETYYPKNKKEKTVKKITLNSFNNCKTPSGFGIGSTYKEIEKEFGSPNQVYFFTNNKGEYDTKVSYNNMDVILNGTDTLNSKIVSIEIFSKD